MVGVFGGKVLILEDDAWYANSLAKSLQNAIPGLTTVVTNNPQAALEAIDNCTPDLLIADLHLGGQNFLTLLNELISYDDTLVLPKIILSSSGRSLFMDDLRAYGVVAVFDKTTYDFAELVRVVQGVLG